MKGGREYFSELLGNLNEEQDQDHGEEEGLLEEDVEENNITREEVQIALKEMKNGKSPGYDEIPVELPSGSEQMVDWLHQIFSQAWTEGSVPEEWRKAIICPIYKKEDKNDCKKCRGISLLSHTGKVYERILEKKIKKLTRGSN